jgi:RecA/RadA recombinase
LAKKKNKLEQDLESIECSVEETLYTPLDYSSVVSTGSTLLDLEISGERIRGGGLPGGIIVEIFGPPSAGKTALFVEMCASAQSKGGDVYVADPEGRLDREYASLTGLNIPRNIYSRPKTVSQLADLIRSWKPTDNKEISIFGTDSIAALSTEMEMESGDKRGQRKAKELSELCRTLCLRMAEKNTIFVFTNQERQGDFGKTTPGGFAVPFHASLRLRIARAKEKFIEESRTINWGDGVKTKETQNVGIKSTATIVKTSISSSEGKEVPLDILFRMGIDDIRANLVWLKKVTEATTFLCVDKNYVKIRDAIAYIEKNNYEAALRENVINAWENINNTFTPRRKSKKRF